MLAVLLTAAGCALTSKSDPLTPRYYNPDGYQEASQVAAPTGRAMPELRLGRVTAASYLGERIVYRDSNHEIGYYDERRWTEKPDVYLRRALERKLFEQKGVHRVLGGVGPTLDIELTDFEELHGPTPTARARATFILQDGRSVVREQTVSVDRRITGDKEPTAEQTVLALSGALGELVDRVTTAVLADLDKRAPPPPKQPPAD